MPSFFFLVEYRERLETPEEGLGACLDSLENVEAIIKLAESKMLEILEPQIKSKYRVVIQALKTRLAKDPRTGSGIVLPKEHRIVDNEGNEIIMKLTVNEISDFSDISLLKEIDPNSINHQDSRGYLILIGARDYSCWINLKLFKLKFKDGSEKTFLYIADRYVVPQKRGKKIGEALLDVADEIASNNLCSLVFANLIPETSAELSSLIRGHQKAGYRVTEESGSVTAKKEFSVEP